MGKVEELEETLRQAHRIDQTFYEELLEDYTAGTWEQILDIQEKRDDIAKRLPDVSDEEFDEFVFLGDLLAVLLK